MSGISTAGSVFFCYACSQVKVSAGAQPERQFLQESGGRNPVSATLFGSV